MKKSILLMLFVALMSTPVVFADRDPITNGGFETGDKTGWVATHPVVVSGGHSGSYCLFIENEEGASQNLEYPGVPTTDLMFWGKTVQTDQESYIVVWLSYVGGDVTTQTVGPFTNTWQMFTANTDKTKILEKVAVRTFDENFDPDVKPSTAHTEEKYIDDINVAVNSPTIFSCESDATVKDTFDYMEPVSVKGTYYPPMPAGGFRAFNVYVVNDLTWSDGMTIPSSLLSYYNFGQAVIWPDTNGDLAPSGVVAGSYWDGSGIALKWLDPGYYDIIIDINNNGVYDEGIDALDDNDVNGGGIEVIDPLGSIIVKKEVDWGIDSSYMNTYVFDFTISMDPYSFTLQDGGTKLFNDIPSGSYMIGEDDVLTGGWDLYDVEIIDPDGGSSWTNPYQVTIDLDPGETVTVIFKNKPPDFVIPEVPLGTFLMISTMLAAVILTRKQPKL